MESIVSKEQENWIDIGWHQFRGMNIRYGVRGGKSGGMPLIIFNGVGQSIEVLEPLITALKGVEVIAYDVPGTGLSDTPRLPWRYRQHARLAADLLQHLGYESVAAMGISWRAIISDRSGLTRFTSPATSFSEAFSYVAPLVLLIVTQPDRSSLLSSLLSTAT